MIITDAESIVFKRTTVFVLFVIQLRIHRRKYYEHEEEERRQ
jgi:hypothetical protein